MSEKKTRKRAAAPKQSLPTEWCMGCLVGKYFHSISSDGHLGWQGCVVGSPEPGWYMVVLFDWFVGGENGAARLVAFSDMTGWLFYQNAEEMNYGYQYGDASALRATSAE